MMIIKNMEAFGKAVDEGKEFEFINYDTVDEQRWGELALVDFSIENIRIMVDANRIRTKPTITYYRVLNDINGDPLVEHDSSPFKDLGNDSMFTVIHKFQLESED